MASQNPITIRPITIRELWSEGPAVRTVAEVVTVCDCCVRTRIDRDGHRWIIGRRDDGTEGRMFPVCQRRARSSVTRGLNPSPRMFSGLSRVRPQPFNSP